MKQEQPLGFWITVILIGILASIGIVADFFVPQPGDRYSRSSNIAASNAPSVQEIRDDSRISQDTSFNTAIVDSTRLEAGGGVREPEFSQESFVQAPTLPEPFPTRDPEVPEPELTASAVFAVLFPTERVLVAQNEEEQFPPASITKLATALAARQFLEPEEVIVVSKRAVLEEGVAGRLVVGEKLSFHDLLALMLVPSSNDAAIAIAEAIGEESLLERMNAVAEQLRMHNTYFLNATGLHAAEHVTTAQDLVQLGKAAFQDPLLNAIMAQYTMDITSVDGQFYHRLVSTNDLLPEIPKVLGGKTGYTEEAGQTMLAIFEPPAAYRERVGRESFIITVVLGSQDRIGDTRKLFYWLQEAYHW